MDGKRLKELVTVAQAVEANFTLEEVEDFNPIREDIEILKMIAGLVDRQGEQLAKLDISIVTIMAPEDAGFLFALLRMSHSWRMNLLLLENNTPDDYWTNLPSASTANGHINHIIYN